MKLCIVESPGKVKKLKEYLGSGWEVVASVGHVRDLPVHEMGVEPPEFRPVYEKTERGAEVLKRIAAVVHKVESVYLATDLDREGEAIAWHLKDALGLNNPLRVTFSEITKDAILEAIRKPRQIDVRLVAAQEGRRVMDRLVGYMVSPLLAELTGERGMSAGRVQSPAVKLVVEREKAIKAFRPTKHYGVVLRFGEWFAEWETEAHLAPGQSYILDRKLAEKVAETRTVVVKEYQEKISKKNPPPPFITSTLQQAASNRLKFSPEETMELAQKLYEQGVITYHRTDNPNISKDALPQIFQVASEKGLKMAMKPRSWKAKDGAQEAHEAIRPTQFSNEQAGENEKERALYRLIWARAVACQLKEAVYAVTQARLTGEALDGREVKFTAKGRRLLDKGWMALVQGDDAKDAEKKEASNPIPKLEENETLIADKGEVVEKTTKAPKRFTKASLIGELERQDIGRPSTYAAIMKNIISVKGYIVENSKRFLEPTEKAHTIIEIMDGKFRFMDYEFTRKMEAELDKVATGESAYRSVVSAVYAALDQDIQMTKKQVKPLHPCPACGSAMRRLKGKDGHFWGCSKYPECKETRPDENGHPGEKKARAKESEYSCQECGKPLVRRKKPGKYDFYGCSGFPKCKRTYKTVKGKPDYSKKAG